MACGSIAPSDGVYNGACVRPRTASSVNVTWRGWPVTGSITSTGFGSDASSACQRWASVGWALAHAGSAAQSRNNASMADCASMSSLSGSTMSGGATPSMTARRTCCGYTLMYSSAARVP